MDYSVDILGGYHSSYHIIWIIPLNLICYDLPTKDRHDKDIREVKEIKKRWQEYTEELYKKGLNDPHNHDVVVTHLEPDILECGVEWALGSNTTNKASGCDGMPAELL